MLLRFTVLVLILANGLYWAWSQHAFASLGWAPENPREPQRVQQQLRANNLRLLSAEEAKRLETAAATPVASTTCLVSALLDERQAAAVQQVARTLLPANSWTLDNGLEPGRWIIYMGRFPSAAAHTQKKNELRQINVGFEEVKGVGLEPGLNLGAFDSPQTAAQQLNALNARGVRTARVLQERAEVRGKILRLGAVDEALRARLEGLNPALAGKPLQACKPL